MTSAVVEKIPMSEKIRDRDVVIDNDRSMVLIDGVEFPFFITTDGIHVEVDARNVTSVNLTCRIYASNVTILPKNRDETLR